MLSLAFPVDIPIGQSGIRPSSRYLSKSSGTGVIYIVVFYALIVSLLHAAIIVFELDTPTFHLCNVKLPIIVSCFHYYEKPP